MLKPIDEDELNNAITKYHNQLPKSSNLKVNMADIRKLLINPIDRKKHRYYPDFIIKTAKGKRYMIEIKPSAQTKKPRPKTKKTKAFMRESLEYIKNVAKWQAADVYCNDNNMEFKIFTEKELGIY